MKKRMAKVLGGIAMLRTPSASVGGMFFCVEEPVALKNMD